jgi:hypothetical protein
MTETQALEVDLSTKLAIERTRAAYDRTILPFQPEICAICYWRKSFD